MSSPVRYAVGMLVTVLALWWSRPWGGDARPSAMASPTQGPAGGVGPLRSGPDVPLSLNILVDQFGYRPQDPKVAVVRSPREGFDRDRAFEPGMDYEVRAVDGDDPVFRGRLVPWNDGEVEASSGDVGWWFDFSGLDRPGRYYVYDVRRDLRSAVFRIDPDVFREVLRAALRVFYYQRSSLAKRPPYADPCWADAAAYVGPRQDGAARDIRRPDDARTARDLRGGWFDAGDTNKYVTFAASVVHQLLGAYRDHPRAFSDDLGIPESGNGIPDVVDEVRWEIDWLRRMQNPDGSALLKLGVRKYVIASPPSSDTLPRFYVGPCTSASIAAAGMFAHAALVFGEFPALAAEAADLRARAISAFEAWRRAPQAQTDCDEGKVLSGDADRTAREQGDLAVLASAYLYALTGQTRFQSYFRDHYRDTKPYRDFGWSRYDTAIGESLLFYASLATADPQLARRIMDDKLADARNDDTRVYGPGRDLYRSYLHPDQYHWGSNTIRVAYGNSNLDVLVHELDPEHAAGYRSRALDTLHYLHGVNPFGIVYLSNMYRYGATYSVNEMFHVWFAPGTRWSNAQTSACGPAPGYLVGGPNASAEADGVPARLRPPVGQPLQKSFRDWNEHWPLASYPVTEPSTGFQANYVRLLAGFVAAPASPP